MEKWIKHGAGVAIWTRDHTWVDDEGMRQLLTQKAERGELTLCIPKATSLSEDLRAKGANVVVHGFSESAVRFTIINLNNSTYAVALARPGPTSHVIEEYSSHHPMAALAKDLVELARRCRSDP
jgi:hypothetical protein